MSRANVQRGATKPKVYLKTEKLEHIEYEEDVAKEIPAKDVKRYAAENNKKKNMIPQAIITDIIFKPLSDDMIKKIGVPITSVDDPKMGVYKSTLECPTCGQSGKDCSGHLGYINLIKESIIYPSQISIVIHVLRSICDICSQTFLDHNEIKILSLTYLNKKEFLKVLSEKSDKVRCRTNKCEGINRKIKWDLSSSNSNKSIFVNTGDDKNKVTTRYQVSGGKNSIKDILGRMSNKTIEILQFREDSKPVDFVHNLVPFLPPCNRQSIMLGNRIQENDLTKKYQDVLNSYNKNQIPEMLIKISNIYGIKSGVKSSKNTNNNQPVTISGIFSGKSGLFRRNLETSRVGSAARSVTCAGADLNIDEVGVPLFLIREQTVPILYTKDNEVEVQKLLKEGKIVSFIRGSGDLIGNRILIGDYKKQRKIELGDTIERELQEGDYTLVNRQPTISQYNIIAMKIKFNKHLSDMTIRINLPITPPLGADFDGDEINLHFLQTLESIIEAEHLLSVDNNLVSTETGNPVFGLVQDCVLAVYLLSTIDDIKPYIFDAVKNIIKSCHKENDIHSLEDRFKNKPGKSGRDLFSLVLPKDFYYKSGDVLIEDGIWKQGVLKKKHIGISNISMIKSMVQIYTKKEIVDFLSESSKFLVKWISTQGFSMGLYDCLPKTQNPKIKEIKRFLLNDIVKLGIEPTEKIELNTYKRNFYNIIDNRKNEIDRIIHEEMKNTNFYRCVDPGAKGTIGDLTQVAGIIGQQSFPTETGKFVPTLTGNKRYSLFYPIPEQYSDEGLDPTASGYCFGSYVYGLTLQEMFNTAVVGRLASFLNVSLTPRSGHTARKLSKALENTKIGNITKDSKFLSVCDASTDSVNTFLSMVYGGDGFDTKNLIKKTYEGESIILPVDINYLYSYSTQ